MKIGVFASGGGSNFEALALSHPVSFLVCDQEGAGVLERASRLGVKTYLIPKLPNESREQHEERIWQSIRHEDFSLLALAGWMRLFSAGFVAKFPTGALINIHPSLLPLHPGRRGYEETFASGATHGGITVHEVDAGMDTGRILAQQTFAREPGDDLASFKARGLSLEHALYPQVVSQLLAKQTLHRVEVLPAARDLLESPDRLVGRVLWLKTQGPCAKLGELAQQSFADPVSERLFWRADEAYRAHLKELGFGVGCLERGFLPGVTDNAAMAATEAFNLKSGQSAQLRSGETMRGGGRFEPMNPLLHWERTSENAFQELSWREVKSKASSAQKVKLPASDEALMQLNQDSWWALTLPELKLVREFYQARGVDPTDVEMEIIAQTWSEHCKHKIFRANISFESGGETRTVNSLFKTYIKGVTDEVRERRGLDWLVSVFDDNAGVVRWDDKLDVAIKVETHNSPSALDPYGGALTGILGVNRDILGVGMGARPVANTNVFCLAPHDLDQRLGSAWPATVLPPARIRQGVHAGVKDGGNKSGIPTVNGAFHYDVNFAGKPLVFCGTLGVLPHKLHGRSCAEKPVSPRDNVVMVGGRIGKDGLHGATFSSMEWKEGTPASVVQIGDPLTQKRVTDFILEARDLGLYSGITDNGAGGLSSSVGEMASFTGGADIDLMRAPVKYPGLSPWELMVSESQERMTVAVPPQQLETFLHLAQVRGVEATSLGTFTATGELVVRYGQEVVAKLPLNFLHEGLPPMELKASWNGEEWKDWCENPVLRRELPTKPDGASVQEALLAVLNHANVRSHESWVRQYDHEVQAATVVKPFSAEGAPGDAGVIALGPHGGGEFNGIAVGSGLTPQISRFDPYVMGVWAVDEAVRNTVCVGGNPNMMAMVDNFCWPDSIEAPKNPGGSVKLGMLVRTCEGMADACKAYGLPLVSGKDSMKNDAQVMVNQAPVKISALPTLLMTCMAQLPDVRRATPSMPREAGLTLARLAIPAPLSSVTLSQAFRWETRRPGAPELSKLAQHYQTVHEAWKQNLIQSAHDVGEGGVLTTLAEMSLGKWGVETQLAGGWDELFGEGPGQLVVAVKPADWDKLVALFPAGHVERVGVTRAQPGLSLKAFGKEISAGALKRSYQEET